MIDTFVDVDFDVHHRLEDLLVGTHHGFVESVSSGYGEGIGRGINNMGCSVLEDESGIDDGVAGLWAFGAGLEESFTNCCDVLGRYVGSYDFTDELISGLVAMRIDGFDVSDDSGVLTGTTWLFFMEIIEWVSLEDGLTIVNTGLSGFAFDAKLSSDSFDVDLKMELTHTTDYHFLGLSIDVDAEGRVFSFEFGESFLEFGGGIRFGRFDGETHDGIGHKHAGASGGEAVIGNWEGISCGALDTKESEDITCLDLLDLLHVVGMHFNHSRNFNFFPQFIIPDELSSFEFTLIDPNVGQLSEPGLFQFENIAYKRFFLVGGELDGLLGFFIFADEEAGVDFLGRRREVFKHTVES